MNRIEQFKKNLLKTNRNYSFFVNWENIKDYKIYLPFLDKLDILIKNKNFDQTFKMILKQNPEVIKVFPLLIALSKKERELFTKTKINLEIIDEDIKTECFNFNFDNKLSDYEIEKFLLFFHKTGLKKLFLDFLQNSVIDYVLGILVGLDSNGRKNRSGSWFEKRCFDSLKLICDKNNIILFQQQNFKNVQNINDMHKIGDFLLLKNDKMINIEVNFFFNSGSKPIEIIDSYINRNKELKNNKVAFILITDGPFWSKNADFLLEKMEGKINYFNFSEIESQYFEKLLLDFFKI
ncbi:DpnII family type II restriction endonuclease [Mycoplasma sp. AC157]|uniref:DpnII family type II restriction endonuclease n=1 Tax=Mycoplasma sp. 480 TaxID=3440155 RepID=UPI003F5168F3